MLLINQKSDPIIVNLTIEVAKFPPLSSNMPYLHPPGMSYVAAMLLMYMDEEVKMSCIHVAITDPCHYRMHSGHLCHCSRDQNI